MSDRAPSNGSEGISRPPALRDLEGEVDRVARLAGLALSSEERIRLSQDLEAILEAVRVLTECDVENVLPTLVASEPAATGEGFAHATASSTRLRSGERPDRPTPSLDRDEALALAPETADDGFAVPPVLEGGR